MRSLNIQEYTQLSQYFDLGTAGTSVEQVIINVILLLLMTGILGVLYTRAPYSLSNRKRLAVMFPILGLTTMMIISIIQSSLALSLGLVGALSIIRFRAAIKEPEELIYIFLVVSLGLGFGAQQRSVTILFFLIITGVLVARMVLERKISWMRPRGSETMYLDVSAPAENGLDSAALQERITSHCDAVRLKRVDDGGAEQQWLFEVVVTDMDHVEALRSDLRDLDDELQLSLVQHESMF